MSYLHRIIEDQLDAALRRGKSVLLFGARQTGKTTLLKHHIKADLFYSFARLADRVPYEKDPVRLESEIVTQLQRTQSDHLPLIVIDEAQITSMYEDYVASIGGREERKASHILIQVTKDDPAAENAAMVKIALLKSELDAGADFAELAKENSQDSG